MASGISQSLLVKYGLSQQPSEAQVRAWVELTEKYIALGIAREKAGAQAAQALLPGYQSMVYASQADAIEALLNAAKGK